jgi:hypothetical protein
VLPFVNNALDGCALAETYATQAVVARRRIAGKEDWDTLAAEMGLALAYEGQRKFAECELLAREIMTIARKKQPDDWLSLHAETLLGASLAGQKKYAAAEPLLLEGYRGMVARKDHIAVADWYHVDRARDWIVDLYQAWGKPGKATEWRKD